MSSRISSSELDVMDIIWAHPNSQSGLAASDIHKALSDRQDWSLQTVKTLLSRLVDKGAIAAEPEGRRYLYSAILTKDAYARRATQRLSDRLFGGRAAPIVAHLAESDGLTETDIADLEALIRKLKT